MRKRKIVIGVCFTLLLIITFILPVGEYLLTGEISKKSISGAIALLIGDVLFLVKNVSLNKTSKRKSYAVYESEYEHIIGNAFKRPEAKKDRQRLLDAIYTYNQNDFTKAIPQFEGLLPKCQLSSDRYAVMMFIALCYTDMGAYKKAIEAYERLLDYDMTKSDAWSNLGFVYRKLGNFEKQVECYLKSIEYEPQNAYAYNNLAQALFDVGEYEASIPYAQRALELKSNLHPAASCLAMCYCAIGNEDACAHYTRIALTNGSNSYGLNKLLNDIRRTRTENEND